MSISKIMKNKLLNFQNYAPKRSLKVFYEKKKLKIWFVVLVCLLMLVFWVVFSATISYYERKINNNENRISNLIGRVEQLQNVSKDSVNRDRRSEILGKIAQCADLGTIKIYYRQVVNMVVDRGDITLVDWATLNIKEKIGKGRIIMPIDVTVCYGFDLSSLSIDDIKVDDNASQVWVYLPQPKIISTDFKPEFNRKSIILMAPNKLAMEPTTEEIENAINRQKDHIISECKKRLSEDETKSIIKINAKNIFQALINKLGFKNTTIEIADSNLKH